MSPDSANTATDPIRIVLVGTQHPGNIGSAARAMKTMGLQRLVLVAPEKVPDGDSFALAAGAGDVLAGATICAELHQALIGCTLVLGCTARSRRVALPETGPREAATNMVNTSGSAQVALVFGRERTGLTNEELQLCHGAVHIPANPEYSSLNLAAAVQVMAYEIRMARLAGDAATNTPQAPVQAAAVQASHEQLEGLYAQLAETLDAIDFHKGRAPHSAMRKLRLIFNRAGMDEREVRLVRGILADAQRMARLAAPRG